MRPVGCNRRRPALFEQFRESGTGAAPVLARERHDETYADQANGDPDWLHVGGGMYEPRSIALRARKRDKPEEPGVVPEGVDHTAPRVRMFDALDLQSTGEVQHL